MYYVVMYQNPYMDFRIGQAGKYRLRINMQLPVIHDIFCQNSNLKQNCTFYVYKKCYRITYIFVKTNSLVICAPVVLTLSEYVLLKATQIPVSAENQIKLLLAFSKMSFGKNTIINSPKHESHLRPPCWIFSFDPGK